MTLKAPFPEITLYGVALIKSAFSCLLISNSTKWLVLSNGMLACMRQLKCLDD